MAEGKICPPEVQKLEKVFEQVAVGVLEELEHIITERKRRAIIISGPTGVGKTSLSLKLAEILNGEIISADSMQIYRGMDIGTAKISKEIRKRIPHHLIDIRDIKDPYHVVDFYEEAKACLQDIMMRGKVPIVAGGTGFYIHALLYGPPSGPPADKAIRAYLQKEYEKFGIGPLYQKLSEFDPAYAKTITRNDAHKVLRALEIIEVSGKPVSSFEWKEKKLESYFDFRCFFIHKERKALYQELERRCDEMLEEGLLEEVVKLDRQGIRENRTASQAIGYKQSLEFLSTAKTKEDYELFVENFKIATRHLVKRQFTWFRKEPLFQWLDLSKISQDDAISIIVNDFERGGPTILP